MKSDPGPKRVSQGTVVRVGGPLFMLKEDGGDEDGRVGRLIACDLLDGWLEGKRARITVEAAAEDVETPASDYRQRIDVALQLLNAVHSRTCALESLGTLKSADVLEMLALVRKELIGNG